MQSLHKLTLRSLKKNKLRTLMTILGIALSVALITVVSALLASARQTMINSWIQKTGDYTIRLQGEMTEADKEKLSLNRNVESIYAVQFQGVSSFESKSKYHNTAQIYGIDPDAYEPCFHARLSEGRFPQEEDEIMLSASFMAYSVKEYHVGDTITPEIDPGSLGYDIEAEENQSIFRPAYKIVGILDTVSGAIDTRNNWVMLYTIPTTSKVNADAGEEKFIGYSMSFYLKLTGDGVNHVNRTLAELTGLTEAEVKRAVEHDGDIMEKLSKKNPNHIGYLEVNKDLLKAYGYEMDRMIPIVLMLLYTILVFSSVFIIRNSFAISITEKTKLYGILSSVGASPSQIRKSVFFEGLILGAIGIPLGLVLGIGLTWGLSALCNAILSEELFGIEIAFCVSVEAVVLAVALAIVTILLSCMAPAQRAARISPLEAIRGNRDIHTKNKKKESLKTPALIKKLFGVGGSIAWKNLRRSRKQYHTTVVSIVLSVTVFISLSSYVIMVEESTRQMIGNTEYELSCEGYVTNETDPGVDPSDPEQQYYLCPVDLPKSEKEYQKLYTIDHVEKVLYYFSTSYYYFSMKKSWRPEDMQQYVYDTDYNFEEDPEQAISEVVTIVAVNDEYFNELAEKAGVSPEQIKNQAILYNYEIGNEWVGNHSIQHEGYFIQEPVGLELNLEKLERAESDDEEYAPKKSDKSISLTIGAEIRDKNFLRQNLSTFIGTYPKLIVTVDWFKVHIDPDVIEYAHSYVHSTAPDVTEQKISEWMENSEDIDLYVENVTKTIRMNNAIVLVVKIFMYGFILVLFLIGMTNIFNTITTNMERRRREFAMLRSVGMTKREFDRMVALESLFYAGKSLLIGIALGLGASFGAHLLLPSMLREIIPYQLPWLPLLISILAVTVVIWMIMQFSIRKVRRQNIIEVIRDET